jgi:N utilization substance protein A
MVTNELRGERVDVVPFSDDPVELIQNALAPARVREVRLDEETGTATVIVSDFQLSLAIGKEGQNARLAARLTGWRIDIKSETQLAEEEAGGYGDQDWAEGEWIEDEKGELVWKPAEGGEAMSAEEWTHQAEDPTEAPAAGSGETTDGAAPAEPAATATATATATAEGASEAGSEVEASVGEPEAAAEAVVEEIVVVTEVSEEAEA